MLGLKLIYISKRGPRSPNPMGAMSSNLYSFETFCSVNMDGIYLFLINWVLSWSTENIYLCLGYCVLTTEPVSLTTPTATYKSKKR